MHEMLNGETLEEVDCCKYLVYLNGVMVALGNRGMAVEACAIFA